MSVPASTSALVAALCLAGIGEVFVNGQRFPWRSKP